MQLVKVLLEAEVDNQHIEDIENTVFTSWDEVRDFLNTTARVELLGITDEDGRTLA